VHYLFGAERLGHEPGRAECPQTVKNVARFVGAGHGQDRKLTGKSVVVNPRQYGKTINFRHLKVQEHKVNVVTILLQLLNNPSPVINELRLVTRLSQDIAQLYPEKLTVVRYKYALGIFRNHHRTLYYYGFKGQLNFLMVRACFSNSYTVIAAACHCGPLQKGVKSTLHKKLSYANYLSAMQHGFNENILHNGLTYHVQTEDGGGRNPVVTTTLFKDGAVIATRRTSYSEMEDKEGLAGRVMEIMRRQHTGVIGELQNGRYDSAPPNQP
jgi:hypothetical protein